MRGRRARPGSVRGRGISLPADPSLLLTGATRWLALWLEFSPDSPPYLLGHESIGILTKRFNGLVSDVHSSELSEVDWKWVCTLSEPHRALYVKLEGDGARLRLWWQDAVNITEGHYQYATIAEMKEWARVLSGLK